MAHIWDPRVRKKVSKRIKKNAWDPLLNNYLNQIIFFYNKQLLFHPTFHNTNNYT